MTNVFFVPWGAACIITKIMFASRRIQGEVQAPLFSLLSSFTTPIYSFYALSNLLFDLRQ